MAKSYAAPGAALIRAWRRLSPLPGGTWLFSRLLGWRAPYTGTIGAHVIGLQPGYVQVALRDHWRVRNHLNSIHAIALMNLGEVATGLAIYTGLPPGIRGIITGLSIEFFKKARGRVVAESRCTPPEVTTDKDHRVHADIRDQAGDTVARVTALWRLSPAE